MPYVCNQKPCSIKKDHYTLRGENVTGEGKIHKSVFSKIGGTDTTSLLSLSIHMKIEMIKLCCLLFKILWEYPFSSLAIYTHFFVGFFFFLVRLVVFLFLNLDTTSSSSLSNSDGPSPASMAASSLRSLSTSASSKIIECPPPPAVRFVSLLRPVYIFRGVFDWLVGRRDLNLVVRTVSIVIVTVTTIVIARPRFTG